MVKFAPYLTILSAIYPLKFYNKLRLNKNHLYEIVKRYSQFCYDRNGEGVNGKE